jgi:hypothetical protein
MVQINGSGCASLSSIIFAAARPIRAFRIFRRIP